MSPRRPARAGGRRTRLATLVAPVVVGAALVGALGHQSSAVPGSSGAPRAPELVVPARTPAAGRPQGPPLGDPPAAVGAADGVVPDGVTVFDDEHPAVAQLDPALLRALRRAATDAADDGVRLQVNSGWRSATYQQWLLDEAIAEHGSKEEAARWVATPATSPHVSGEAVDLGPSDATAWLSDHGAGYGLCQTYRNEPWHYELRPDAPRDGCPRMYADPTHDPRLRR